MYHFCRSPIPSSLCRLQHSCIVQTSRSRCGNQSCTGCTPRLGFTKVFRQRHGLSPSFCEAIASKIISLVLILHRLNYPTRPCTRAATGKFLSTSKAPCGPVMASVGRSSYAGQQHCPCEEIRHLEIGNNASSTIPIDMVQCTMTSNLQPPDYSKILKEASGGRANLISIFDDSFAAALAVLLARLAASRGVV